MTTKQDFVSAAKSFSDAAMALDGAMKSEMAFRDAMGNGNYKDAEQHRFAAIANLEAYFDHATVAHKLFNDGKKTV